MITEPSLPGTAPMAVPRERRSWRIAQVPASVLRRHWMLAVLLTAGLGLRVVTQIPSRPVLFYIDSYKYLTGSGGIDPEGYRVLMAPFLWATHNLAVVPIIQHGLGLATGLAIYTVLVRRGAPRWAGALAAAPILLDGYQLQMEQTLMPDVAFEAIIAAGLTILLWTRAAGRGRAGPGPGRGRPPDRRGAVHPGRAVRGVRDPGWLAAGVLPGRGRGQLCGPDA